jgi:hypothetical protein
MDYTRLGTSELMISRIALGCMGFADPARLAPGWTLDEDAAGPIFRQAAELGVTFWDTASVYSSGTSVHSRVAHVGMLHRARHNDAGCPRPLRTRRAYPSGVTVGVSADRLSCASRLSRDGRSLPGDTAAVKVKGELKLGVG